MKIRSPDIPVRALGQGCPIYEEDSDAEKILYVNNCAFTGPAAALAIVAK
jgi:hypothetical protein